MIFKIFTEILVLNIICNQKLSSTFTMFNCSYMNRLNHCSLFLWNEIKILHVVRMSIFIIWTNSVCVLAVFSTLQNKNKLISSLKNKEIIGREGFRYFSSTWMNVQRVWIEVLIWRLNQWKTIFFKLASHK